MVGEMTTEMTQAEADALMDRLNAERVEKVERCLVEEETND